MSKGSTKAKPAVSGDGSGADGVEKHHKYRCRELKRQLGELEEYNEALAIRLLRSQKRLRRMKIERNVLLERFERTQHYGGGHHDDDDDSASDSDAPLKDTFPRPQLSDVDMNDQSLYMPTSATTTTSTVSGRGRRKNQTHVSTGSTPRQQSLNGTHGDHSASAVPTTTTSTATPARKPRAEKDPHAPKRPANAFVMFCQSERPSIKSSGIEMTSGELTRAMSAKWKNLPRSEKQRFYDNYEREMVRYQQELLTYKEGGTAPPTPASDSAAIKSTNAQQKQQQQPPSSSASAVIVEENGTDTTSLPVDPPQQQPSSASSTSSAFAASTIKKSSVMDIGVISDRAALPLESSSPKRNGTGPPSYIAEPETLPAENYHHRSDGVSTAPPLSPPLAHPSVVDSIQTNGNSASHSMAQEEEEAVTRPDEHPVAVYTTKSIEDGMRTTALHET